MWRWAFSYSPRSGSYAAGQSPRSFAQCLLTQAGLRFLAPTLGQDRLQRPFDPLRRLPDCGSRLRVFALRSIEKNHRQCVPDMVVHLGDGALPLDLLVVVLADALLQNPYSGRDSCAYAGNGQRDEIFQAAIQEGEVHDDASDGHKYGRYEKRQDSL